jgi:hypothetical protein
MSTQSFHPQLVFGYFYGKTDCAKDLRCDLIETPDAKERATFAVGGIAVHGISPVL